MPLIHPTSTGSSQSHTRGGRAASVAGWRQARAEGERAGGRAPRAGVSAEAGRAGASAEGGRARASGGRERGGLARAQRAGWRARGERCWPAPGERGGHLQPW